MMTAWVLCCVLSLLFIQVSANEQSWSSQTYLHARHALSCYEIFENKTVNDDYITNWTKLGSDVMLTSDEHYLLENNNRVLIIRNVTDNMAGIYICHVRANDGSYIGHAVKGVNIDGYLYDDLLDKYKTNIIRGAITTASVFVLVVGVGIIDRFRYLSDEQKQKRRDRREERKRRLQQPGLEGRDNLGMNGIEDHGTIGYGTTVASEANSRL